MRKNFEIELTKQEVHEAIELWLKQQAVELPPGKSEIFGSDIEEQLDPRSPQYGLTYKVYSE